MLRKGVGLVLLTLLLLSLVMTGCNAEGLEKLSAFKRAPSDDPAAMAKVFGPVDQRVQAGPGWAVLSPAKDGTRELAYLTADGKSWKVLGNRLSVQGAAQAAMRLEGTRVILETSKSGAPQYAAYQMGAAGPEPVDYYAAYTPEPTVRSGKFVLVNKRLNALWHYSDGKLVKTYRVATGRQTQPPTPTWEDYKTNFFTPEGTFKLTDFKTNPPYTALKPGDKSFAGGAPGNPLGTRWMGFAVLEGDGAGIWGIHGTAEPEKIGTWASDGCIRMFTNEAEELFGQLKGQTVTLHVVGK